MTLLVEDTANTFCSHLPHSHILHHNGTSAGLVFHPKRLTSFSSRLKVRLFWVGGGEGGDRGGVFVSKRIVAVDSYKLLCGFIDLTRQEPNNFMGTIS